MRPLARLVFLGAVFSIGSVRHLETLLSTKLDSSPTNDLSASGTRASVVRRCVLGLGAASIGPQKFVRLIFHRPLAKLRRVEIQASQSLGEEVPLARSHGEVSCIMTGVAWPPRETNRGPLRVAPHDGLYCRSVIVEWPVCARSPTARTKVIRAD